MRSRVLSVVCRIALVMAALGAGRLAAQPTAEADGAALFVANGCWQCHGYEGQGGEAARIAPTPYPFEAFLQFVRRPAVVMPAYSSESLSDADLRKIFAYVQSRPEPPAATAIPLLN